MSGVQKYAALPDLDDAAPDIYETPDLTDGTSTLPASTTLRSESPASSYDDLDEGEVNGISRRRLDPDEARTHFLSDTAGRSTGGQRGRIISKRRSYKESNRRTKADGAEVLESENISEDDDEGFDLKLARLRREIAEVRAESERRRVQDQDGSKKEPEAETDDLDSLSRALDGVESSSRSGVSRAATRLIRRIESAAPSQAPPTNGVATQPSQQPLTSPAYTFNYAPTYPKDHTLAKVADFDARLTMLETILGVDTVPLATQHRADAKPILPALGSLQRQMSVVSNATDSSLESKSRRIKQLTKDAEKLTEARKAAKAAQEALSDSDASSRRPSVANIGTASEEMEDPERLSKINALYGTLPTIESLSPLLPPLLDRLRSLRSVHAEAANANQRLSKAESRQAVIADELKSWREGLEKIEGVLARNEQTMNGNMSSVEGWVRELEERVKQLAY